MNISFVRRTFRFSFIQKKLHTRYNPSTRYDTDNFLVSESDLSSGAFDPSSRPRQCVTGPIGVHTTTSPIVELGKSTNRGLGQRSRIGVNWIESEIRPAKTITKRIPRSSFKISVPRGAAFARVLLRSLALQTIEASIVILLDGRSESLRAKIESIVGRRGVVWPPLSTSPRPSSRSSATNGSLYKLKQ